MLGLAVGTLGLGTLVPEGRTLVPEEGTLAPEGGALGILRVVVEDKGQIAVDSWWMEVARVMVSVHHGCRAVGYPSVSQTTIYLIYLLHSTFYTRIKMSLRLSILKSSSESRVSRERGEIRLSPSHQRETRGTVRYSRKKSRAPSRLQVTFGQLKSTQIKFILKIKQSKLS